MRLRITCLAATALAFTFVAIVPGAAASPHYDRSCGIPPGNGYVNIVRVANMSCRHGKKIAFKARKKFCNSRHDCPFNSDRDYYKGKVVRNGWKCKVALGYEYFRAKCRRGSKRLVYITGA